MNNGKYIKEFNITLVDVIFGILIGTLFSKFEFVTTFIGLCLFFFILLVFLNYWYTYRKWFDYAIENQFKTNFLDVIADIAVLFIGFQFANNFYKWDIVTVYYWFIGIFVIDCIWTTERFLLHQKITVEYKNRYKFWIITDIIAIIIFFSLLPLVYYYFEMPLVIVFMVIFIYSIFFIILDIYYEKIFNFVELLNKQYKIIKT